MGVPSITHFSKTKYFLFYFYFFIGQSPKYSVDSLRSVLCSASEKYYGQFPIRTLVSLQEVLWTIFENYFFVRSKDMLQYIYIYIYIYSGQSLRIIFILDVPSNPTYKVDYFHALTPMSCDARAQMQCRCHSMSFHATCTLHVPSNPKYRVDYFHALTPMSCDAPCTNAMQVSFYVISCYMYTTCHMQHINHTLHVKWHK